MMGWLCCVAVALVAGVALLWQHHRTARLLRQLDEMLEAAASGHFSAAHFDESQLSALENRLAQYLQAGEDAAAQLTQQRDGVHALVSDIAHQTRTPVANLRLYTQLLEEGPLTPQAREQVAVIASQTEKLASLMDALVKTSRLETGLLVLHPQPQPLAPILHRAVQQYAAAAAAKGLHLHLGAAEGTALCDGKWTEEALCILIDNAVKYTETGTVEVAVEIYPMFCALCVRDSGPGLSEAEQARIFARFYRSPAVREQPGVGLGLYLARQIASGQGGYIRVTSAPGAGSTFALYLPRAEAEAQAR